MEQSLELRKLLWSHQLNDWILSDWRTTLILRTYLRNNRFSHARILMHFGALSIFCLVISKSWSQSFKRPLWYLGIHVRKSRYQQLYRSFLWFWNPLKKMTIEICGLSIQLFNIHFERWLSIVSNLSDTNSICL